GRAGGGHAPRLAGGPPPLSLILSLPTQSTAGARGRGRRPHPQSSTGSAAYPSIDTAKRIDTALGARGELVAMIACPSQSPAPSSEQVADDAPAWTDARPTGQKSPSASHGDNASGHRVRIDELVQMPAGDPLDVPTTFPGLLRHAVIRRPEQQIPAWPVVPATRYRNLLLVVAQRKPGLLGRD